MNDAAFGAFTYAPSADFGLLRRAADEAAAAGYDWHLGPTASSDTFYHPDPLGRFAALRAHGIIAVDMETSALYTIAARFGARALSICTVVDNLVTGEETARSERQHLFADMTQFMLRVTSSVLSRAQAAGELAREGQIRPSSPTLSAVRRDPRTRSGKSSDLACRSRSRPAPRSAHARPRC